MRPERWFKKLSFWLRLLLHRRELDQELNDEIGYHLEAKTQENIAKGMTLEEARRAARIELGGVEQVKERVRAGRTGAWLDTFVQDLRFGLRMLRKSPGFTSVAILTLALGIGANTAIFSFTDQVLLRNLPVPHPEQLVVLRSPGPGPSTGHCWSDIDNCAQSFSYPMYGELRERATVFSGLLAYRQIDLNVSGDGVTQTAHGELVSGNFFQTLEVPPALGRVFTPNDETAPGANPVAVLSYGYWTRQFGGDPSVLNKPLFVNGVPLTVVGVARKGFFGVEIGSAPDIFIPVTMKAQMAPNAIQKLEEPSDRWLPVMARLKPGISLARAQVALQPIYGPILESEAKLLKLSGDDWKQFVSKPLLLVSGAHGRLVLQQDAEEPLLVLMSMVGLVLLIACANVAGLVVARGEARQREIAVRMAMGASRGHLVRQLLTESLLIGVAGGAGGIALASWGLKAMVGAIPSDAGLKGLEGALDLRVLWFAVLLTLLTSVLSGLAPAMRATRVALHSTLKEQGSSVSEGHSSVGLRRVLIVAQVALTAVLLAGAGLFARTLINLEQADLGINPSHLLQFSVAPDLNGDTLAQTQEFADRARREIAMLPGVRSVSVSSIPMFSDDDWGTDITPEGYAVRPGEDTDVLYDYVSGGYFSTVGIPLIAGREFTDADNAKTPKVCIINAKLAQQFFAGRNPLGLHIEHGVGANHLDMEIVGVVANSKWDSARSDVVPFMYVAYSQVANLSPLTFYVRTERDPAQMAASLHSAIAHLDPSLPINNMRTVNAQLSDLMFNDRLVAALSVSLALLAALLAALGLYGVLAYVVARRTREIGIRMALGGGRADILRLVVGQGVRLTVIGGAIGIVVALVAARYVASLLYGVNAHNPLTFVAVVALLAVVSGTACYLPASRAMKVDPIVALRYE
jgi:putative ABC transport system permease protein